MSQALAFAVLAAVANVIGGLLVTGRARRNPALLHLLVAFGAGFMLAVEIGRAHV